MRVPAAMALTMALAFPAVAPADSHREAVLRLVSVGVALRDAAKGMLGIDVLSRMAAPECAELLQDIISMRNLQAVSAANAELVVKWHGKRELVLRARGDPTFALEVHDKAGPACTVASVQGRGQGGWQGKLTPVLLESPDTKPGPAQVFVVDPVRSPVRQPLE